MRESQQWPAVYDDERTLLQALQEVEDSLMGLLKAEAARLAALHREPFDRLMVAQAQMGKLALLTAGPLITRYKIEAMWVGRGSSPC